VTKLNLQQVLHISYHGVCACIVVCWLLTHIKLYVKQGALQCHTMNESAVLQRVLLAPEEDVMPGCCSAQPQA
jgi:hypothetical protein